MKKFPHIIAVVLLSTLYITHVNTSAIIHGRIISGEQATLGQFPWQVIIKRDEYDSILCGGSIISNSWVLTAAHCTSGFDSLLLLFGTIHLDDYSNNMTSNQFSIHPEYNPTNLTNDISLIELPTPLSFSDTIKAIALVTPSQASNDFVGSTAIIAGFGLTDDEYLEYSNTLLWAKVQIITNKNCAEAYGGGVIKQTNICSKGDGNPNKSICSGDSGGPLIVILNHVAVQIGINSFVAEDRCTEGFPSVYVRLTSYMDYVSSVTGLNFS